MPYRVTVLPQQHHKQAQPGEMLLAVLRRAGFIQNAPCGGNGKCGKCSVTIDGKQVLACQTPVDRDLTVLLAPAQQTAVAEKTVAAVISASILVNDKEVHDFEGGKVTVNGEDAALVDEGKTAELVALLEQFGVKAITQLKAEQYLDFATGLCALGGAM